MSSSTKKDNDLRQTVTSDLTKCRNLKRKDSGISVNFLKKEPSLIGIKFPLHLKSSYSFEADDEYSESSDASDSSTGKFPIRLSESSITKTHSYDSSSSSTMETAQSKKLFDMKLMDAFIGDCKSNTKIAFNKLPQACNTSMEKNTQDLGKLTEEENIRTESENDLQSEDPDTSSLEKRIAELQIKTERLEQQVLHFEEVIEVAHESRISALGKLGILKLQEEKLLREYSPRSQAMEGNVFDLEDQLQSYLSLLSDLRNDPSHTPRFHIWHNDYFGVINGFRLGRIPYYNVEWNEINSAWAQTILLLNFLAKRIKFTFSKYELLPNENLPVVKILADNAELPLHASHGISFEWRKKLDQGMVAVVDCLKQLETAITKLPGFRGFGLPYKITDEFEFIDPAIEISFSIRSIRTSEEYWTTSLGYLLHDLKYIQNTFAVPGYSENPLEEAIRYFRTKSMMEVSPL